MAEYVKFRLTAAKVGVTMALAALIAGIAEKAHSGTATVSARPAALFVKLNGITGNVHNVLAKIEAKVQKIDSGVISLQKKVRTEYYTKGETAKIYEKSRDASAQFLAKDATAANSSLLGNKGPNSFVQGNHASVITGAATIGGAGGTQTLLTLNGTRGAIIVVCRSVPGGGTEVVLNNGTNSTIPAVQDENGGQSAQKPLAPGPNTLTTISGNDQFTLQTFPTQGFNQVLTLTVSAAKTANGMLFVGQMLNGDG